MRSAASPPEQETEIKGAGLGEYTPLAPEPRGRRRDELEAHVLAEEGAHLAANVGEAVDQAELQRAPARPELSGEEILASVGNLPSAPLFDEIDEGRMHVTLQRLDPLNILRLLGEERIERVLALAGGIDAPLDTDLGDQLVQAEGRRDDSDRADDRAWSA